jgi:ribosomal protein S12 methylthiotransferase
VEGAAANAVPDPVPEEVKQERKQRLMMVQEDISTERIASKIDRKLRVLVDEVDEEGAIARSYADAPDIDGLVYITDGQKLKVGEFVEVTVNDTDAHDMWATLGK